MIRQAWRESGFWRPGARPDDIEVIVASNTGEALAFDGTAGDLRWDISTLAAVPTPTAKHVGGEKRLYGIRDGRLEYATELSYAGPFTPHLKAALERI